MIKNMCSKSHGVDVRGEWTKLLTGRDWKRKSSKVFLGDILDEYPVGNSLLSLLMQKVRTAVDKEKPGPSAGRLSFSQCLTALGGLQDQIECLEQLTVTESAGSRWESGSL